MYEIDFRKLAGTSKLFLDFINCVQPACGYYRYDFRKTESYSAVADQIDKIHYQREKLASIITGAASSFGLPEESRRNVEKLAMPGSLCVFAGQQVGVLLGPMYTVLKALTAYKLARKLESELGRPVVPCFWMATDDHDFEEIKSSSFLDREGVCKSVSYEPAQKPGGSPMSEVELAPEIEAFLNEVEAGLLPTEFSGDIKALLRRTYRQGRPVGEAFTELLQSLLAKFGVIPVDPNYPGLKKLFAPAFEREIENHDSIFKIFEERSQEIIHGGYHRQVHKAPESLNLFFSNGIRRNIVFDGENFALDGYEVSFAKSRLLEMLAEAPEKFSSNVTLRPIVQNMAFPTVAQIVGPSEAAYFAQIAPLFDFHGVPWPVIRPRLFGSLIEPHIGKMMRKLSVDFVGLVNDTEHEVGRVIRENFPPEIQQQAENLRPLLEKPLADLARSVEKSDHESFLSIDHARRRIDHELNHLSKKLLAAHRKKHDDARKRVYKIAAFLLPCGKYQERILSPVYFANKFGPDIFERLEAGLSIDSNGHQMVDIEV